MVGESLSKKSLGARVLKAVSSPIRLRILRLMSQRGPLPYTEIMNLLNLSPSRDAGKFAYHLKTLLHMDLIEPDVETKKYGLTSLGKAVVGFADDLDENAFKKKLLVRTSRLAIENFDRNKILESLVKEAEIPIDLAQKIARETEKRLQRVDTKYLTAPLIREFVNAILIERGLEEYRHKLTRLGLPVYDVTQLIKTASASSEDVESIRTSAGNRVLGEYTLLNVLPRDIADAHLSGALNINNLGSWILKPSSVLHDLRFFFANGLVFKDDASMRVSMPPPKSLKAALSIVVDVLRLFATELSCEQHADFFNVFVSPYVKGLPREEVKEELDLFLASANCSVPTVVSLGLETAVPSFLAESRVSGTDEKSLGAYADYADESRIVASLLIECLKERKSSKPMFNPSLIVKVRPETLSDSEAERLLFEAHGLAVDGLPYFANLCFEGQMGASYTASGLRLAADWKEDWELDTVRTGSLDRVALNLPRAAYDAKGDKAKFFENLYDLSEKALRALGIKYHTIRQRAREGLLSLLVQRGEQDPYYRLENTSCLLSFIGLSETAQSMTGKSVHEGGEALGFAEEAVSYLAKAVKGSVKKQEVRYALCSGPDAEAARRLAELDIEKYGLAEARAQGGKGKPFYTNMAVVPQMADASLEKYLGIEEKFHALTPGGHLARIGLWEPEPDVEHLLSTTKKIVARHKIGFFAYDRSLTYCSKCQKTFHGDHMKCPVCGSVNAVTRFSRQPAVYQARHA
jgi:ribonucleoside-triphosphate reductase